jgi:hypothetical protein
MPLVITEDELGEGIAVLEGSLREVSARRQPSTPV